ncbi:MAG: peptide ABC transporter substrate-binding protein [Verrucomicrobia bacterium]|nr:MAG: peptide ABC transporter substrate-binding protein [Verrucomicrobiota bacterium]
MGFTAQKMMTLLAVCSLICGCTKPEQDADLVVVNGLEPGTIDPALLTGQPERRIASSLFEGLTRFNEKGHAVPGMAESWQISPNGKTYVFRLRRSAYWSDGKPVTAQDFVDSWKRALLPSTGAAYSYQLDVLKNAEAYEQGKIADFTQVGVKALDTHTLQVELENPAKYFLDLCAIPIFAPVRPDIIERHGGAWTKPENIVGNGPFILDQWRLNDRIRLRKNPRYWDAAHVRLHTLDLLPVAVANTALNFYYAGQVDVLLDKGILSPLYIDVLKQTPDYHAAPFLGTYFLAFNCTRKPFDDPRVRLAFSLVAHKERITKNITRAGEQPASGLVPPGVAGYSGVKGLPYDPARARELLKEAGYPSGRGLPFIEFLYNSNTLDQGIAIELQDAWRRELGVTVSPTQQEWKVYLNSLNALNFDVSRRSWVGDYADPNTFLEMFTTGNGNNRTGWSNPKYDRWIAQALKETDAQKRFRILAEAEDFLVNRQGVICPIFAYVGVLFFNDSRVGGLEPNLLDEHPFRTMYRKDPRR